jgi:hypothetical protein
MAPMAPLCGAIEKMQGDASREPRQRIGQEAALDRFPIPHPGERLEIHAAFDFANDAIAQHVEGQRVEFNRHVSPFRNEGCTSGV